jgi:biopolymer transport protein ExbB/TolQ
METVEAFAMMVALLLMLGSIGVKVVTAQLITRMRQQIGQVASVKQEVLNRLKVAQSQKAVADQNKGALINKKTKLVKRFKRLKRELSEIEEEVDARKQRQALRKIE